MSNIDVAFRNVCVRTCKMNIFVTFHVLYPTHIFVSGERTHHLVLLRGGNDTQSLGTTYVTEELLSHCQYSRHALTLQLISNMISMCSVRPFLQA